MYVFSAAKFYQKNRFQVERQFYWWNLWGIVPIKTSTYYNIKSCINIHHNTWKLLKKQWNTTDCTLQYCASFEKVLYQFDKCVNIQIMQKLCIHITNLMVWLSSLKFIVCLHFYPVQTQTPPLVLEPFFDNGKYATFCMYLKLILATLIINHFKCGERPDIIKRCTSVVNNW